MRFKKEIVSIRCNTADCEPGHPLLVGADSKMVPISHISLFMMTATYCFSIHFHYKTHTSILQPKIHPLLQPIRSKAGGKDGSYKYTASLLVLRDIVG